MSYRRQRPGAAMMDFNRYHVASDSPNSSEEVESQHGTPETKLSAFSPEEFRDQLKLTQHKVGRSSLPPAFTLNNIQGNGVPKIVLTKAITSGCQDPFVASPSLTSTALDFKGVPKLSPMASSFTPLSFQQSMVNQGMLHNFTSQSYNPGVQNNGQGLNLFSAPAIYGASSALTNAGNHSVSNHLGFSTNHTSSRSVSNHLTIEVVPPKIGSFSSDGESSRSLMISQVRCTTSPKELEAFFSVSASRIQ